jgi:hypothetical protein
MSGSSTNVGVSAAELPPTPGPPPLDAGETEDGVDRWTAAGNGGGPDVTSSRATGPAPAVRQSDSGIRQQQHITTDSVQHDSDIPIMTSR